MALPKMNFTLNFEKHFGCIWPGWIRFTIWAAVVLVLTAFMIRELSSNLGEFTSNNIVPQIDAVAGNGTQTRPNITICLPYYSGVLSYVVGWIENGSDPRTPCDVCDGMRANEWDLWNRTNKHFDTPHFKFKPPPPAEGFPYKPRAIQFPRLAASIIEKLLSDEELGPNVVNEANVEWSQVIVDALWLFFSCQFAREKSLLAPTSDTQVFTECPTVSYISDASVDRLFDLLLNNLAIFLRLRSDPRPLTPEIRLKNVNAFIPMADRMCFPMPWPGPEMSLDYMPTNYGTPWFRTTNMKTWLEIYEDVMPYDLYSAAPQTLFQTERVPMRAGRWTHVILTYNKETHINVRMSQTKCSDDIVPMACLAKVQFARAVEKCECVPFSLRYLRRWQSEFSKPYCNETLFAICTKKDNGTSGIDRDLCNKRCEYTSYRYWPSTRTEEEFVSGGFGYHIKFVSADGSFIKFDYTSKMTVEQFMSQVGGTLNLYLGLSGLTVCSLVIFFINVAKRWRRNSVQTSNQSSTVVGFQLFWFVRLLQLAAKDKEDGKDDINQEPLVKILQKLNTLEDRMTTLTYHVSTLTDRLNALEQSKDCQKPAGIGVASIEDRPVAITKF